MILSSSRPLNAAFAPWFLFLSTSSRCVLDKERNNNVPNLYSTSIRKKRQTEDIQDRHSLDVSSAEFNNIQVKVKKYLHNILSDRMTFRQEMFAKVFATVSMQHSFSKLFETGGNYFEIFTQNVYTAQYRHLM